MPDLRAELAVLTRPVVLGALATTVLGAGAMFTLYTYVAPTLAHVSGATPAFVTAMLVLIGVGFSIGNIAGGRLADRSLDGTLIGFLVLLIATMAAFRCSPARTSAPRSRCWCGASRRSRWCRRCRCA
jgi:DHA1 family inner membrane transport protein